MSWSGRGVFRHRSLRRRAALWAAAGTAAAAAFATSTAQYAHGALITFTGAISNSWDVGGNWSSGTAPTAADDLLFPSTFPATGLSLTLSAGEAAGSLTFQNNYVLNGSSIALSNGTINCVTSPTINSRAC